MATIIESTPIGTEQNHINSDTFDEFKALMMYFNEPLLDKAGVNHLYVGKSIGGSFEGGIGSLMAKSLCRTIWKLESETEVDEAIFTYAKYLKEGYEFMDSINNQDKEFESQAKNLQTDLLNRLDKQGKLILPAGWRGSEPHAIALIIEKNETNPGNFNLIVVNTGAGLHYHYSAIDPNNVYPKLHRLWIEYKNIPKEVIFPKSNWFMYPLIFLKNSDLAVKVEANVDKLPDYFYGSILVNFKKYMAQVDKSNLKLFPAQRSGSCSLSSLIASLLYLSKDDLEYHKSRILIGHKLLEEFLIFYEKDDSFIGLITDSFDLTPRQLLRSTSSALAQQLLVFLEFSFDSFKHAGLVGSERQLWLESKKNKAVTDLKNHKIHLNLVKKVVKLGLDIEKILLDNPVSNLSSKIFINPSTKSLDKAYYSFTISNKYWIPLPNQNMDSLLNLDVKRPFRIYSDIGSIYDRIQTCAGMESIYVLQCVRDTFKQSENEAWWNYLNDDESKSLPFLKACTEILKNYMKSIKIPNSLDDIVALAHLQIGIWKSAVIYDGSIKDEKEKLNLDKFKPPQIIEAVLKQFNPPVLAGDRYDWPISTVFSHSNLEELDYLLDNYSKLTNGTEEFFGIRHLQHCSIDSTYKSLTEQFPKNFELYQKMFNESFIASKIKAIRMKKYYDSKKKEARWLNEDYVTLTIFLTLLEDLNAFFPHYAYLIDSSAIIYIRMAKDGKTISNKGTHIFPNDPAKPDSVDLNVATISGYRDYFQFNKDTSQEILVDLCYVIKLRSDKNIFYHLRHSQAHRRPAIKNQRIPANMINFESWLNYVKGAPTAKIFDDPYFSYLSDRTINMPILSLKSDNRVELSVASKYPPGFEKKHIKDVFLAFERLMKIDLNILIEKKGQLARQRKTDLLVRAANLAISLIKFIGRIDYDKINDPISNAKMMARVYLLFYKFSPLETKYDLDEQLISTANLVLTLASSVPIRNPKTFLDYIKEELPNSQIIPFRRTLARIHWFITKIYYCSLAPGKRHIDDIFTNGFIYYPIAKNEIPHTDRLLKDLFISKFISNPENISIQYSKNGDLILIKVGYTNNESIKSELNLGIQLSSGKIIKNGSELVEKTIVINDSTFTSYFAREEDRIIASRGEISKIGNIIIYIVPNYKVKGNNVVLLCKENEKCLVYRKYSGDNGDQKWYLWSEDMKNYINSTRYKLFDGHKLYETKEWNIGRAIVIRDDELEPLNRIITSRSYSLDVIDIEISNFSKNDKWRLLNYDPDKYNDLQKHIKSFTNSGTLLALCHSIGSLVVIYPGLRLPEDPKFPLVLLELENNDGNTEFQMLNTPDWKVESSQVAIKGIGIAGTLIARNKDGQRFILAPSIKLEDQPFTIIEKIPIVDNLPAPQTRLHKLLLAYYCLTAREYNLARELLHPSTSILLNEPFNLPEHTTLSAIMSSNTAGPEAQALKLMTYMHLFVNSRKFPLDEHSSDISTISNELKPFLEGYLMAIRELPEKFYVHQIFPDFLSSENLEAAEKALVFEELTAPREQDSFSLGMSAGNYIQNYNLEIDVGNRITEKAIGTIFWLLNKEHDEQLDKYLSVMSKLIYRTAKKNFSTYNTYELIVLCAKLDRDLFKKSANLFFKAVEFKDRNRDAEYRSARDEFTNEYEKAYQSCRSRSDFSDEFTFKIAAEGSKSTDAREIFKNLSADVKKRSNQEIILSEKNMFMPVNENDLNLFETVMKHIKDILKPDRSEMTMGFSESNLKISKVLTKLVGSVKSFVKEGRQYAELESRIDNNVKFTKSLKGFRLYLEGRIGELKEISKKMAKALSDKIGLSDYDENPGYALEVVNRYMHQRKIKKFESLYSCYQRMSPSCIHSKFPQLSPDDCKNLLSESMKYYSIQILEGYFNLILEYVEKFLKLALLQQNVPVDEFTLFLDEAGKISEFNKRLKTPSILNFEYRSKQFRLRTEQVNDITELTTIDPNTKMFKSVVIQRMMAAGKTLVLGTISVVKKALDGTKLSILVPPTSLYQSNLSSMQARTYKYFKTKGHNFIFPRFQFGEKNGIKKLLVPFLKSMLRDIENIQKANDYYVLSPDSLQSFLNSYIEMINFHNHCVIEKQDITYSEEALELYAQLYNIFRTKGSIILDEVDMTMDPKKELNFPTIENEPFNMLAATLMTDLIEFSVFDKDIITKCDLDIHGNNQAALTNENYINYRNALLSYIDRQLGDKSSIWFEGLLNENIDVITSDKIIEFLKNEDMSHMRGWIESIIQAEKHTLANALIIIKLQLHKNLKESLKSTANLNFGSTGPNRPDSEYAIPYLAANTPSPSSEFADRWETLNKTLLMLASVSCPERLAKRMILYLKKRIIEETSSKVKLKGTATYKNIALLIPGVNPLSLNHNNQDDVKTVHEALKTRSPAAIRLLFSYALDEIFSEMKFPVEQITSNALNMASMFGSIQGYSGTIDNVNILPREVVAGAYTNHMLNEKNNGGISLKLVKDSRDHKGDKAVFQISDDDLKKPINTIISVMINNGLTKEEREDLSAIIDTGAFFKNFTNKEVAEAILKNLKGRISVVLYYDEVSNQIEFIKDVGTEPFETGYISNPDPESIYKATQTDISKRFTFYDQRHITGSDILQPKKARALMTIGTRVLLRDILQGTLRMRQFMTSQKVHLITSTSAVQFYFSKSGNADGKVVTVPDMITLGAFNEDDKQLFENEKLAFVKIDNEIRRFVIEEITSAVLNSDNYQKIIAIWFKQDKTGNKNIRDLFIRSIKENPIGWLVKYDKKNTNVVLKNYVDFWIKKVETIGNNVAKIDSEFDISAPKTSSHDRFKSLKDALNTMISPDDAHKNSKDSLLAFMEPKITERNVEQDGGGEVEMQAYTQQLTELDLENLSEKLSSTPQLQNRSRFDMTPLIQEISNPKLENITNATFVDLYSVLNDEKLSSIYYNMARSALKTNGKNIAVSKDLILLINNPPLRPYKIFSVYTWEGSHILVQVLPDKKGARATLLSTESANEVYESIISDKFNSNESTFWLCDLSGQVSISNDPKTTTQMNITEFMPGINELFFDLLIFNGSLNNILTNQKMTKIFWEWLKNVNFQHRATFLLLRMHVLAKKTAFIIEEDSPFLSILNKAARGDKDALSSIKLSSGAYKKPPVDQKLETDFFNENSMLRPSLIGAINDSKIDINSIFLDVTGYSAILPSYVDSSSIEDLDNDPLADDANVDDSVDKVDIIDVQEPVLSDWVDVKTDAEPNTFTADDVLEKEEEPEDITPTGDGPSGSDKDTKPTPGKDGKIGPSPIVKTEPSPVVEIKPGSGGAQIYISKSPDQKDNTIFIIIGIVVIISLGGGIAYYFYAKKKLVNVNSAAINPEEGIKNYEEAEIDQINDQSIA